tara:strand:- start:231 stop:530 length:300 start_codon:yes stop_codon:yes gene_type:complete
MDYVEIGLVIGSISTIVSGVLTLKKRWFKDNVFKALYLWWDGKKYSGEDLFFSIRCLFFYAMLMPFFIALTWGVLLPIGFLVFIVLKIRKRNINKNKEN